MLPEDFYCHAPIVSMLAGYDFRAFLLQVRRAAGWTQQTLAGVVGLTQSQISTIERGEHRLRDIEAVAGVARGLGIPPGLLNFPDIRSAVGTRAAADREEASWMDRRDFGQYIAGLVLGIAGASGLDTARLLALLPQAESSANRRIGTADVDVIEKLTVAFVHQDFAHGSGLIRAAAVAQMHAVLPLLDAEVSDEIRPRLQLATAALAMQAGWMSFDVLDHDAARRLWMVGLEIARNTDHPQADDLTTYLLYDMALQAVHLDRPNEALHLVRIGETAAMGRHPVSVSTIGCLASIKARAHASQGDTADCDRALGKAVDHFAAIDPAATPSWGGHVSEFGMAAFHGAGHYALALAEQDQRAAERAITSLRNSIENFSPGYGRLRALYLPDLAGSHAIAGDTDTAVTVGHQAVDAVSMVSSPRTRDRLRTLRAALEPLHTSPGVADLRGRLAVSAP